MAKEIRKKDATPMNLPTFLAKRVSEGLFLLLLASALFVLLSLFTYKANEAAWFPEKGAMINAGGQVGLYIAGSLYWLFGYFSYLFPVGLLYVGGVMLQDKKIFANISRAALYLRISGLLFLIIGGASLVSLQQHTNKIAGGALGNMVALGFDYAFNLQGSTVVLFAIVLVGITLLTGLSWITVVEYVGFYCLFFGSWGVRLVKWSFRRIESASEPASPMYERPLSSSLQKDPSLAKKAESALEGPTKELALEKLSAASAKKLSSFKNAAISGGLPALSLLDITKTGKGMGSYTHQELEKLSREVEQHLLDFGIHADVVAVHPGPVVTRFELQLAAGIKVSKLTALAKDLARSLSVMSVRVVEVIPGKTVVGLELPNQKRDMVCLHDVLSANVYTQAHSPITIALGVDIAGHPMVVDLAKMPHLLVAGTTGSGKSVGINAMILSLLFKATPEQVRLILIDPKMLELSVYDGIPHLLTPVVTDMKEAASALRWSVMEMERRYKLMAALGVRNLIGFNAKITEAQAAGTPCLDPLWKPTQDMEDTASELQTLPYVVIIIDELADMMMVVGKKVEQLIARIAQKARAAGIHLVLATQRPSVDVLTGLIKSNIPTRMSFQVSSKIDSRTILDQQGAEQLLGHGDMLYLAPGTGAPLRVHGAFVDDKEVHRIADDWRARGKPQYIEEITQLQEVGENGFAEEEKEAVEDADPLYDEAVEFVIQTRKASVSAVQRKLKIGYNRAARLVEEMERTGLVGPLEGGMRDVLVKE